MSTVIEKIKIKFLSFEKKKNLHSSSGVPPWSGRPAMSESQNQDAQILGPVQVGTVRTTTFVREKDQQTLNTRGRKQKESV